MMKKRVLVINPWAIKGDNVYTDGFIRGISEYADITFMTNWFYNEHSDINYQVQKVFFKHSQKMLRTSFRMFLRGLEYIKGYICILKELRRKQYDVVHIQWILLYKFDRFFMSAIKPRCKKMIYTAHNVIPHINGEKSIADLNRIYSVPDTIILHGKGIYNEFKGLFPHYIDKVYIQHFGINQDYNKKYDLEKIDLEVKAKMDKAAKIYLYIGTVYYNKGIDRVIRMWKDMPDDELLVVIGIWKEGYEEIAEYLNEQGDPENIIIMNKFVEDDIANYLIFRSDLILIPYRHASMSSVVYMAANFEKTFLATDVGAIKEYANEESSFIVKNDVESMRNSLLDIAGSYSRERLADMGRKQANYIIENYNWEKIAEKVYKDCY